MISDMSEGGLGLTSGRAHQVGEKMTVSWPCGPGAPSFQAECSVKHATANQVGVEFSNIAPADRQRILEFLRNQEAALGNDVPSLDYHDSPNRLSKSMILGYT
jgi:c-di-GMP-binding flagellar brake protein YcgR